LVAYVVDRLEDVTLDIGGEHGPLDGHDLMSPFVWIEGDMHRILVRVVPRPFAPGNPTGIIWSGESRDGLAFKMSSEPSILPGPDEIDAGGVEDPTVIHGAHGAYRIFYTGVDRAQRQGSLLVAEGPDLCKLVKKQVMLKAPEGEGNIKEATLARGPDGKFRLFYEYARDNASRIGMAVGPSAEGPWKVAEDPFTIREGSWDNWHLSTGPIVQRAGEDPVMFYNGATADARWRIGWVAFNANFTKVTARGVEPLLVPPPPEDRGETDIAFAASCLVARGKIILYYSLEDRILRRAHIRQFD
jgi:predicted GH43/DUF377 family glycosyl hydrolase